MFICHGNGWSFVQTGNFGVGELCFITITMNKLSFTIRFLFIDRFLVRAPIEPKFDKRGGGRNPPLLLFYGPGGFSKPLPFKRGGYSNSPPPSPSGQKGGVLTPFLFLSAKRGGCFEPLPPSPFLAKSGGFETPLPFPSGQKGGEF